MRRAPIVITATIAGLAGVLAFHTTPAPLSFGTVSGGPATSGGAATSQPPSAPAGSGNSQPGTGRTAVGPEVNYNYGVLSVKVTLSGNRISEVGIASLDDGGMFRSQFIDQQAIPILEHEAIQAQSANIQGVSGASYTSAGFEQSLQAALRSLGLR